MNGLEQKHLQPVSHAERRVLEQIYTRQSGHISPRALATLIERGLVRDCSGRLELTPDGLRML